MRSRCACRFVSASLAFCMCVLSNPAIRAESLPPTSASPITVSLAAATTPEAIEQRLQGKTLFLRGFYLGEHLDFDTNGKVQGAPAQGSFTLSGLQVKKVHFTKHSVEIEAERIGLHFFGALPYEDDSKPYESIKISGKPVEISIERLVIEPEKKKKGKHEAKAQAKGKDAVAPAVPQAASEEDEEQTAASAPPAGGTAKTPAAGAVAANTPGTVAAPAPVHRDPRESYVQLSAALDKIFANTLDQSVIDTLPGYWQTYFATKAGKVRTAVDAAALHPGGDVKAPHLLAMINPDSNDYAQKSGIAGMILLQTVVSSSGRPGPVTIVRPIGFGLDEKAIEAVEHSQFRPGTQNGKDVPVLVNLEVTFRIYSDRTRPRPGSAPVEMAPKQPAAPEPHHDGGTTVAAATVKE